LKLFPQDVNNLLRRQFFICHFYRLKRWLLAKLFTTGWQISNFGQIFGALAMEVVGKFYVQLVYFMPFWYILRPFGIFLLHGIVSDYLVYCITFWYVVTRKIWQLCSQVHIAWKEWKSGLAFKLKSSSKQVCQIFLNTIYQKRGGNIPKNNYIIKWP
jgi:hypothetical protein